MNPMCNVARAQVVGLRRLLHECQLSLGVRGTHMPVPLEDGQSEVGHLYEGDGACKRVMLCKRPHLQWDTPP